MIISILFLVALLIPILNLLYIKRYLHAFFFLTVVFSWAGLTLGLVIKAVEILFIGYATVFAFNIPGDHLSFFFPVWIVITISALIMCIYIISDSHQNQKATKPTVALTRV